MTEKLITHIKNMGEINPDEHDGSYELVRETVKVLEKVERNELDYKDMNLLFFNTVGTFTKVSNYSNKIKRIEDSNLNTEDKEYLKDLLARLMDKAQRGEYTNRGWFGDEEGNGSIGMFGSGFGSFAKFETSIEGYADFIVKCTEILQEEDEERILAIAEEALEKPIPGLGIAAVSQILHCLKPFIFPILNKGEESGVEAYKKLGVKLTEPSNPTKYVQNTRAIRDFRNQHFSFQNYRVIDLAYRDYVMPRKLEKPFNDIFRNREEAQWAFNFMAFIAERIDISGSDDPRIAISLRDGGTRINFVFCNWLVAGFKGLQKEQKIVLPLIKDKAEKYSKYINGEFITGIDEPKAALYVLPFDLVKDMDEELISVLEDTLQYINQRFMGYKRSPFRSRPSHIQDLVEMIFDEEKRNANFVRGLKPEDKEKIVPNIWWVNQKELKPEFIWAPLKNKVGNPVWHWETLAEVEVGDIILHYTKGYLSYVSRVTAPFEISKNPMDPEGESGPEGRLVTIEYHELKPAIPLSKYSQKLIEINIPQGPLDNTGGIKEGYFFRFNEEALKIIQKAQSETNWPDYIIDIIENFEYIINPAYTLEELARDTYMHKPDLEGFVRAIERKGQVIFYGPPGTGKTYIAEKIAMHLIGEEDGFYEITQFHPAYSYEDFMQGIRPQVREGDNLLDFRLVPGRFIDFCMKSMDRAGTCVLIIDEINRANLARVFGELMYLLEYRDKDIPLAGGKSLRIPDNVRIIGTMNTADRSIALVDYALRRRFAFLPLQPNYEALGKYHQDRDINIAGLINVLKQLNTDIGDSHYEVGHSFFMLDNLNEQLEDVWKMEILPYLEEYFFDQPEKINNYSWDKIKNRVGL